MVGAGEGRKDGATRRISGRARDNRLVHVGLPHGAVPPRPGDLVRVRVTDAAPAFLIADAAIAPHIERTRAGDAWDAREAAACAVPAGPAVRAVSLGLPSIGPRA